VNLNDVIPSFIAESLELLKEMETGLLEAGGGALTPDTINQIFRAAHTIKGSAGLFGLDDVVRFVHTVETTLDRVRLGEVELEDRLIGVLLQCKDQISDLVEAASDDARRRTPEMQARSAQLQALLADEQPARALSAANPALAVPAVAVKADAEGVWHISLRFGPDVLRAGMDPLSFVRYLTKFGTLAGVTVVDEALPGLEALDPERCYLGFELDFRTSAGRDKIEAAFEFVREDCTLVLTPPEGTSAAAPKASLVVAAEAGAEARIPAKNSGTRNAESQTVRVDAAKLDELITRVGELIIAAAGAQLVARRSGNAAMEESIATLSGLVEEVRGGALQLRMVKIGATFSRFRRVVHDVARELGKEIELLVSGEDTELDKTVVERIADPLTHLVRNAIDHGIEPAATRLERGKPAIGALRLNAYHDSGHIVIEVSDDGGGLKRDKIYAKAVERGLIEEGAVLSDAEVHALIFEPGFSTAEQVTDLSGRGVGMDVVKRNITALRGAIGIQSTPGVGTTISVRLPLTLAIINGFQVGLGDSIYVLPLDTIEECIEFSTVPGHDFTSLRGEMLPFIRLREVFNTRAPPPRRPSIVVVRHAGQRAGIVVDTLIGESQTVIKPLGRMFRQAECVSGSSILGTGDVALILDVPLLVQQAVAQARASTSRHAETAAAVNA
jgi:two-component system chemotaxis sensor kinase CheA